MLPSFLATCILTVAAASAGEPVALGGPAHAFSLPSLTDPATQIELHDFTGVGAPEPHPAVVVHFFSPRAGDQELDALNAFARKHKDVQVLAVYYDPRGVEAGAERLKGMGLGFPVLADEHGVVFSRYGVDRAPLTLVIDADGRVYAGGQPAEASFAADLEQTVGRLLAD